MSLIKNNIFIILILFSIRGLAQNGEGVKISNDVTPPNPSTMLEVVAPNEDKGVLFPKVSLNSILDYAPVVGTATEGVMVYNTNATATASCGEGYYYWNGNFWEKVGEQCIPQMTFAEMIAFTSSLSNTDIGYKVFVTDVSVSTSYYENQGGFCLATTCSPSTINPNGIWSFSGIPLQTDYCDKVLWDKEIPLPVNVTCTTN